MILFVTGQYAGAEYLYPLIKKWRGEHRSSPKYKILATGASVKFWEKFNVEHLAIKRDFYDSVECYLNEIKPRLIILSASSNEELENLVILLAKRKKIRSASFIDAWTNYKNRFIYNQRNVYPDTILSIDSRCTEEMLEDGIPSEIIQEIGQPYLEEVCKNIPLLGKKILIPLQPIKKTRGSSLGYDENDFLNLLHKAMVIPGESSPIQVTSHPGEAVHKYFEQLVEAGRGIEDVKNAHTVIGMFSMQMMIAFLWGRKVVSIQPNLKVTDPSPLSRWGMVPRISDSKKLTRFMNSPISKHSLNQRNELLRSFRGSLDRLEQFCK